jgi:hypothetical protein
MSIHEPSDGVGEEVERQLQLALAAAALAARKAIARREAALAEAQAQSAARADELRRQLERERTLASARIQPVFDRSWWETASAVEVGEMWEESQQWRDSRAHGLASVFDDAAERIEQETRERWQLDIGDVMASADDAAEQDHVEGLTGAKERPAIRQAQASEAEVGETASGAPFGERYDTPVRRERLKDRLAAAHIADDAIEARVLADTAQSRPVADAVQPEPEVAHSPARSFARNTIRRRQRSRSCAGVPHSAHGQMFPDLASEV